MSRFFLIGSISIVAGVFALSRCEAGVCQNINYRTVCRLGDTNKGNEWSIKCSEIPVRGRPVCLSMAMVRDPHTGNMIHSDSYGKWVQTSEMLDMSNGVQNCYMPVTGYAICSSTRGEQTGDLADQLVTNSTVLPNQYCWCKMAAPDVSRWVFTYGSYNSARDCKNVCSQMCATYAVNNCAFRQALFSNL